jgi:hypothetical protein
VRSAQTSSLPYFLGVRLSEEELRQLDEIRRSLGAASRSETIRRLVRAGASPATPESPLPLSVAHELAELVEDGWASSEEGALSLLVQLGLEQFTRLHAEQVPALRGAARGLSERSGARKRADRTSRRLLER